MVRHTHKSKSHKGIKDPAKQKTAREAKFKDKINTRPGKISDQEQLPRKMREILKAKEDYEEYERQKKAGTLPTKVQKSSLLSSLNHQTRAPVLQKGMDIPLRPVPVFQQQSGESTKAFLERMNRTTKSMKRQRIFEEKNNIELRVDPKTGQQTMVKAEKTEEEKLEFEKQRKRLAKKGIHLKTEEEKRQLRRQHEKKRKMRGKHSKIEEMEALNFSDFQDKPEFGEVVDAPPEIKFKARKAEKLVKKDNFSGLLLAKKLQNDGGKKKKKIQDLSLAKKAKMEQERERAIEAYRAIRADKYAKVNANREEKVDSFFDK